jgi:hypothetical protein
MAQQINLFNPIFLQQKKHFSAVTMLQALGLLLAGILVFYAYASFETHKFARVAENSPSSCRRRASNSRVSCATTRRRDAARRWSRS